MFDGACFHRIGFDCLGDHEQWRRRGGPAAAPGPLGPGFLCQEAGSIEPGRRGPLGVIPGSAGETLVHIVEFNPTSLVAGAALVLLAGVFQFGRGLQRDTEGLV